MTGLVKDAERLALDTHSLDLLGGLVEVFLSDSLELTSLILLVFRSLLLLCSLKALAFKELFDMLLYRLSAFKLRLVCDVLALRKDFCVAHRIELFF